MRPGSSLRPRPVLVACLVAALLMLSGGLHRAREG